MQFNLIRWKNRCFANVFPMLRLVGRYLCTVVWTCLCVYECVCTNVCMRVYEFCIYYDLFVMSERHMYADDGETFWHTVLYLWCTFLGSRPASVRCACTLSPIHICTHTHTPIQELAYTDMHQHRARRGWSFGHEDIGMTRHYL